MLKGNEIDNFLCTTGLKSGHRGSLQGPKFCLAAPSTFTGWAFHSNVWEAVHFSGLCNVLWL